LHAQVDRERVGLLDLDVVVNALGCRLDHNVDLMRCTPDAQHIVVGAINEAGDNASMTTYHGVLAVRRHADQLGTPFHVQHVHELGNQIENVDSGMAFEHGHRDEVQVDQLAMIADMYVQVEERLVTMRAFVASQRHGPNRLIVKDAGDLLQRDNDQDTRVLTDNAVIEASKFHRLHVVLGFLNGCRLLSERQADVDIVHDQVKA